MEMPLECQHARVQTALDGKEWHKRSLGSGCVCACVSVRACSVCVCSVCVVLCACCVCVCVCVFILGMGIQLNCLNRSSGELTIDFRLIIIIFILKFTIYRLY